MNDSDLCIFKKCLGDKLGSFAYYILGSGLAINNIRRDPYSAVFLVRGIGYKRIDSLIDFIGNISLESKVRSGIKALLRSCAEEFGSCFMKTSYIVSHVSQWQKTTIDVVVSAVDDLIKSGELKKFEHLIGLSSLSKKEDFISRFLLRLLKKSMQCELKEDVDIGFLDSYQQSVVYSSLKHPVFIITGGPGTGKTTIINGIIRCFLSAKNNFFLCAPTGRAAKRIQDSLSNFLNQNIEARTIHRLISYLKSDADGDEFSLIIDEASMVDLDLLSNILNVSGLRLKQLILVGDVDQLPPIGVGNILKDIINSKVFEIAKLNKIYRQSGAHGYQIANTSQRISNKLSIKLKKWRGEKSGIYFIDAEKEIVSDEILKCTEQLIANRESLKSVQILTPTRRGPCGSIALNTALRKVFGMECNDPEIKFVEGDKIIQTRNNYNKFVFNGDVGIVQSFSEQNGLDIEFEDGRKLHFKKSDSLDLSLAYAITVHLSQGSEYEVIVMPITISHYHLFNKALIYTAMTRAKRLVIMIGQKKAFYIGLSKNTGTNRITMLENKLRDGANLEA